MYVVFLGMFLRIFLFAKNENATSQGMLVVPSSFDANHKTSNGDNVTFHCRRQSQSFFSSFLQRIYSPTDKMSFFKYNNKLLNATKSEDGFKDSNKTVHLWVRIKPCSSELKKYKLLPNIVINVQVYKNLKMNFQTRMKLSWVLKSLSSNVALSGFLSIQIFKSKVDLSEWYKLRTLWLLEDIGNNHFMRRNKIILIFSSY